MNPFQQYPVFDPSFIEDLRKLDPSSDQAMIRELISTLLEEAPRQIQALRDHFKSSDLQRMRNMAHSLKSSTGSLGGDRVSKVFQALEKEADLSRIESYLSLLDQEFSGFAVLLQKELANVGAER